MPIGAGSPFQPIETVTLQSGTASANIQLPANGESVLVTNPTSSLAHVKFGCDPTLQATSADTPVLPNSRLLLRCGRLISHCAAILSAGSGSVMFTRGDGSST